MFYSAWNLLTRSFSSTNPPIITELKELAHAFAGETFSFAGAFRALQLLPLNCPYCQIDTMTYKVKLEYHSL